MVMRSVLISDGEGLAFILAKKQPVSKREISPTGASQTN